MADSLIKQSCWYSNENEIFLNPRFSKDQSDYLLRLLEEHLPFSIQRHLCMITSGTSGFLKWVILSKEAFLIAAEAANAHLASNMHDVWLNVLPPFHVGGLSIYARAWLSGAKVVSLYDPMGKWDPYQYLEALITHKATLSSLVPTQVYDLVLSGYKPPNSLRAVIVGGGEISYDLYRRARQLGWPLLPSYGMTEAGSQIATAPLSSLEEDEKPLLKPLKHVCIKLDGQERLKIKGKALLTGYISEKGDCGFVDPKKDGWFTTDDHVKIKNGMIVSCSRTSSFLKIGGESVDLGRLERCFEDILIKEKVKIDAAIIAQADERLGYVIYLAVAGGAEQGVVESCIQDYNASVLPYERIRGIRYLEKIPRSDLGKVLKPLPLP